MFQRRHPLSIASQIWHLLWPPRGWGRALRYLRQRLVRLRDSHHAIALGLAVGVFVSITPFVGFHLILALAIALLLRANLLGAAIGTAAGNPLTFPLFWSLTYFLGCRILGLEPALEPAPALLDASLLASQFWLIFVPMVAGSLPLGLVLAGGAYGGALWALEVYKKRRAARQRATRHRATRPPDTLPQ